MPRATELRSAKGRGRLARVLRRARGVVRVDDAALALALDRSAAAKLLARWADQGWLKRLRRGVYVPIPIDALSAERTLENPWVLVPQLFAPGYVGGWSAAEHWGLTEQIFREVCVFTTKPVRRKREVVEGIAFVLNRKREDQLFGIRTMWHGKVRIPVSDPHRTVLDMVAKPAVGGGIRHVADCLSAYLGSADRDLWKLLEYADRLANGAAFKRLGFLLERAGTEEPAVLETCRQRMTAGHTKLDPDLPADALVERWRLRIPRSWRAGAPRD